MTVSTEPGQCFDNQNPADNELESGPDSALDFERVMEGFTIRNATSGTRYPQTEPGCEPCSFSNSNCECAADCVGPDAPINCVDDQCNNGGGALMDGFVGGGLWVYRSYLTVRSCVFTNNSSDGGGGAFTREANVAFIDCNFDSNTSRSHGGALQLNHTISNLIGCNITNNQVVPMDPVPSAGSGGAMHIFAGTFTLDSCTVTGNHTTENGGGIGLSLRRSGAFSHLLGDATVTNCVIENNTSTDGDEGCGGLRLSGSSQDAVTPDAKLNLLNTTICNNTRGDKGSFSNFCINPIGNTDIPVEDMWVDNGSNVICPNEEVEEGIEINAVASPDGFEAGTDTVNVAVEVVQGELDSAEYQWYIQY
jgi:hypothetical protein